jgi:hypothetical protein
LSVVFVAQILLPRAVLVVDHQKSRVRPDAEPKRRKIFQVLNVLAQKHGKSLIQHFRVIQKDKIDIIHLFI